MLGRFGARFFWLDARPRVAAQRQARSLRKQVLDANPALAVVVPLRVCRVGNYRAKHKLLKLKKDRAWHGSCEGRID
jgi:hypothetical protein